MSEVFSTNFYIQTWLTDIINKDKSLRAPTMCCCCCCSVISDSVDPMNCSAHQASLAKPTISRSLLKTHVFIQVVDAINSLILCHPLFISEVPNTNQSAVWPCKLSKLFALIPNLWILEAPTRGLVYTA